MLIDELKENVKIFKNNCNYNICDGTSDRHKFEIKQERYKNTIMYKYWHKTNKIRDINILADIVEKHIYTYKFEIPYDNSIVIHIRAGDDSYGRGIGNPKRFMCMTKLTQQKLYEHKNINKIVIVTALNYGHNVNNQTNIQLRNQFNEENINNNLNLIKNFCNQFNLPVDILSSENIDYDFSYLCCAKHLIVSNSGFSKLAKQINKILQPRINKNNISKNINKLDMPFTFIN